MSDSDGSDSTFITLSISPVTGLSLTLDTVEATEELGRPFVIVLEVSSPSPSGDLHALLGRSATVKLTYPEKPTRYFNGIIGRINYRGLTGGGYRYRLELRPWIWLLSQQHDCQIFSNQTPWTIMTSLFRKAGFTDFTDKRQNGSGDVTLEYCVQYRESTLDFVTRLMEQYGIYYFVEHSDGSHSLTFSDDPNSHSSSGDAIPYQYDQTDWRTAEDHIWDWTADASIQPGAYTYRDYNFTTPKADLTAKSLISGQHTHGSSEVYDYPGRYDTANDGQKVAQVRMQDYDARRQIYSGSSNSRLLGAGTKFTLINFPDSTANQEYLIVESICSVQHAETRSFEDDTDLVDTFRCEFRAIAASRPFRLADITPKPMIRGPQTARVAGVSGQEITTDQYGRIKVKFPWDRSAGEDENSSCWIRVAQIWAGQSWGAMFIPRIGQEVVVEFMEGDPDRPLVTGSVYNADMTVPYALPDNATRSTVKSNSSLGGNGFNEFRFEDKKGSEEVFFHAQKDFNETILNNHTETINNDHTATIAHNTTTTITKGDRTVLLKEGDDTLKLQKGGRATLLSMGDDSLKLEMGSQAIEVSNNIDIKADMGLTLTCGESKIEMTPASITISSVQIQIKGQAVIAVEGGAMATLKGGIVMIN